MTLSGQVPGVQGLDHVGLNVPDLEQAVRFFTDAFGATTVFRLGRVTDPEGASMERIGAPRDASFELAMLQLGAGRLELVRWWSGAELAGQGPPSSHVGASHIAVNVSDVSVAVDHLQTMQGVQVLGEPLTFDSDATPGLTNVFLRTPWGALIELVNWGTG